MLPMHPWPHDPSSPLCAWLITPLVGIRAQLLPPPSLHCLLLALPLPSLPLQASLPILPTASVLIPLPHLAATAGSRCLPTALPPPPSPRPHCSTPSDTRPVTLPPMRSVHRPFPCWPITAPLDSSRLRPPLFTALAYSCFAVVSVPSPVPAASSWLRLRNERPPSRRPSSGTLTLLLPPRPTRPSPRSLLVKPSAEARPP